MARTPGDAVSFMGIPLENAAPTNGEAYVYNSSTLQRELSSIGNETITLSGDVTGSGATSITTTIANGAVDIAMLSATGTPSSSTYLRGDNTRATISGGGDFFKDGSVAMTGDLDLGGNSIVDLADVTFRTGASGGTLRTGTSASDKFTLQAYDTNGSTYVTLLEADAGTTVRGQFIADYWDFEDATDQTKIMDFDLSGITTGTTRTITMADQAIDLTPTTGTYQGSNSNLSDVAGLATTDGGVIVGNGANFVLETGATFRTSIGLGSADSPTFAGLDLSEGNITNVGNIGLDSLTPDSTSGGLSLKNNAGTNLITVGAGGASSTNISIAGNISSTSNASFTNYLTVNGNATNAGRLRLGEDTDNGSNYVELIAPSSIAANYVVNMPASADTLVGRDTTDTLTNKTIALGSNTVSGTKAQFDTGCTDGTFLYQGDETDGSKLDGDKIDIDFTPSNYTPDSSPAEADDVDDLAAHLKGIDDELANQAKTNTANTFTANQTFEKEIIIDSTPGTDHEASGPTTSVTAGASVSQFNVCQLQSDGKFDPADSSTASSAGAKGMLVLSLEAKTDTQAMKVALPGSFIRDDTWNWTVGGEIFLSTSGAMTQTAPSTSGHTVRVLGYALTADIVYFNPSADYIELS